MQPCSPAPALSRNPFAPSATTCTSIRCTRRWDRTGLRTRATDPVSVDGWKARSCRLLSPEILPVEKHEVAIDRVTAGHAIARFDAVGHRTQLGQNTARSGVVVEAAGPDACRLQVVKGKAHHASGGLGGIALAPIGTA